MTNIFRNPDALVDAVRAIMMGETNKNDKSDDGDGLDAVQPKAVKKKFADRKDKDLDNDGDTDSSDEYLHKRRKAISKNVKEESDVVDIDIDEAKSSFRPAVAIKTLKKEFEPLRDKRISMKNANKLSAIMNKFGDDKDMLIQLMKADIPFVSQGAVTRLITKHNMKGAQLNKMMKEEVDLDEGKILVADPKTQKVIKIDSKDWPRYEKKGYVQAEENKHDEDEEVPCAECGKVHEGACATEDVKEGKDVTDNDDEDKTDAQKNDMDGDGVKDSKKKKKKKKDDDEENRGEPNKIDTKPEIKTAVSEDVDLDEGKQKPYVSSDSDGKHVMGASGKIVKSFKDMDSANAYLKKNYNKLLKEEVDLDEGKIEDVLAVATQMARLRHSPKGRDWGKLSAAAAQKLIDKEMGKLRYTMTAGGKWVKEEVDSVNEVNEKKDPDGGDENIMMALRKAVSLRGQYDVAFKDGKKVKISQKDAQNLLNRLQKEKPADREALMKSAYKSEKHFKMALKGQIEKKKNPLDLD
jgi:hypothetical protein